MANENLDLEDFLNEELLGIKPKNEKKAKKKIEWKESNPNDIFEEDEKKSDEADDDENSRAAASAEDDSPKEDSIEDKKKKEKDSPKITPEKVDHKTQGKKVMEVSLSLSGQDYGTVDIGDEEYASVTGISSLLGFFNIDTNKIQDPKTSTESLTLEVKETISQSQNFATLTMRTNENDGTISINVLVNDMGQPQENMPAAIKYFNNAYQINILNVINKEVRG